MIEVSIVTPLYNGSEYIDGFIESIKRNTLDPKKYQIIFVDNGSTDDSRSKLEKASARLVDYNIQIIDYRKKAGSYSARNTGAGLAAGRILAFIDIDCRLERTYLENVLKVVEEGKAYAGHVEIESEDKNVWEVFDSVVHLNNEENARKKRIVTANMCIGKKTFDRAGDFDEVYSGGDYLYGKKLRKNNIEIVYASRIKVFHPPRKNYQEIKKKLLRVAYGEGEIFSLKEKSPVAGVMIQILRILNLPKHILITKKIVKRRGWQGVGEFNLLYFSLKVMQIGSFIRGYRKKKFDFKENKS